MHYVFFLGGRHEMENLLCIVFSIQIKWTYIKLPFNLNYIVRNFRITGYSYSLPTKLYEKKCPTNEEDIKKRIITSAHTLAHKIYMHDFVLNSWLKVTILNTHNFALNSWLEVTMFNLKIVILNHEYKVKSCVCMLYAIACVK